MWSFCHVCCCKRLALTASQDKSLCYVVQVFLILLIPSCGSITVLQQQHGMSAVIVPEPCSYWPLGFSRSCGTHQSCTQEASHWLTADQVSLCDHLIGHWGIRYPRRPGHQTGHASFVATGLCLLSLWQQSDGPSAGSRGCRNGKTPAALVVQRTTLWPLQTLSFGHAP